MHTIHIDFTCVNFILFFYLIILVVFLNWSIKKEKKIKKIRLKLLYGLPFYDYKQDIGVQFKIDLKNEEFIL